MREELLNLEMFDSLMEARVLIEDWRVEYNEYHPHRGTGESHPRPTVEGRLQTRTWEAAEGSAHRVTEIAASVSAAA